MRKQDPPSITTQAVAVAATLARRGLACEESFAEQMKTLLVQHCLFFSLPSFVSDSLYRLCSLLSIVRCSCHVRVKAFVDTNMHKGIRSRRLHHSDGTCEAQPHAAGICVARLNTKKTPQAVASQRRSLTSHTLQFRLLLSTPVFDL